VIIRLLTGDDPEKQARSRALFQQIEEGKLSAAAPATVIAEAVYVLASPHLYGHSRREVAELLTPLVKLPRFQVQGRRVVLAALQLYASNPRHDFSDALLAALARQAGTSTVYSYDTDFDRVPGIYRREP
jgi:predicted nucleic acid-binding protein